jgi:Protein of unknown function (DUF1295)
LETRARSDLHNANRIFGEPFSWLNAFWFLELIHLQYFPILKIDRRMHQKILLTLYGCIYMCRLNAMSLCMLKRELAVEELTFMILVWIPSILASFVFASHPTNSRILLFVSLGLYLLGSNLNTYSEYERQPENQQPENKGRCYMEGLFLLTRNMNYFDDNVLFGAWALSTAS